MEIDRTQCPDFFLDYILYITVTKSLSSRTVQEYYLDIRLFLKYLRMMQDPQYQDTDDLQQIPILDMQVSMLEKVQLQDLYNYLYYVTEERENHDRARGRKVSALRSFFGYLCHHQNVISHDPTERLELPSPKKTLPRYLTLEQSQQLLQSLDTAYPERDYCILTLFLNCGIRLSELVGLNLTDINMKEAKMRVLGKGNKERMVYLNEACMDALQAYLKVRELPEGSTEKAVFLSKRHTRISKRRVQQIVETALEQADLGGQGYSTHKLRHTAATLMYQYGNVDALTLKEVLGHASTSTTEIYTHLSNQILKHATDSSPLAHFEKQKKEGEEEES
ncbi:tyrosine-type recombinase/integrase [Ruminococcus sp.]|uniref:tyrosine-type recombinase/integrase n=1 Tax=Ruminococcus sp. TaxID=41978 RepID=UPI0025F87150|nr:tyrosine-type recombinase/integrase [Ruminococcus sp.]